MTPEEKAKKEDTDIRDKMEEDKENEFKKKLEGEGFLTRLKPYSKPVINSVIGTLVSII